MCGHPRLRGGTSGDSLRCCTERLSFRRSGYLVQGAESMPRRESPLQKYSQYSRHDLTARLFVHYYYPADFLYRDYNRVKRPLAAQKNRTPWRASQERCYLGLWLAALFTVIEGYKVLKIKSEPIDSLLRSKYLDSLRHFRHGTFHYQKHPRKHTQFFMDEEGMPSDDRLEWAEQLHLAFANFESEYRIELTVQNTLAAWRAK